MRSRRIVDWARAVAAAAVLVVLLVAPPVLLSRSIGNPWPPEGLSLGITDGVVIGALATLLWVLWAQLLYCTIIETAAAIGGVRLPARPAGTLGWQQHLIRGLVTAVAAVAVSTPVVTTPTALAAHRPPAPDAAAGAPAEVSAPAAAGVEPPGHDTGPGQQRQDQRQDQRQEGLRRVDVRRGDSLWSLAQRHLGDPERWAEIAVLNRGRAMADGTTMRDSDLIRPGWRLRMPADATGLPPFTPAGPRTVLVGPGDTLSGLAARHLGDAARWPDLYGANRDQITDPDLLQPGWELVLPTTPVDPGRRPARSAADPDPDTQPRTTATTPAAPSPTASDDPPAPEAGTQTPAPHTEATPAEATDSAVGDKDTGELPETAPWLLAGLSGAGAALSGGLYLGLRRRRHAQFRARRPGRTIAVPAPELVAAEKTINTTGAATATRVQLIDDVLRRLAAAHAADRVAMPAVAAAELTAHALVLHLSTPADLGAPWQPKPDRLHWMLPVEVDLDQVGPPVSDQPAPYPLLVTIGTGDTGEVWLLNCENLAVVTICGDPTYGADFARYLAAEVAMNPWSRDVRVDCIGVGQEITAMNPARVRYHGDADAAGAVAAQILADAVATVDRATHTGTDVVTGRVGGLGDEVWPARMLLLDAAQQQGQQVAEELLGLLDAHPGRTGTCVVLTGAAENAAGAVLEMTSTGRVRLPHAGLDLTAVGLTREEAQGCAALVATSEDPHDIAVPADDTHTDGWRAYADEAGALREEHTHPRHHARPEKTAEPVASMLEGPDEDYVREAATTTQDLQMLAPQVAVRLRDEVEAADPTLDDDVRTWFCDGCDLPRLSLLGPVRARTRGDQLAVVNRKAYYTELLAYLATRPHGATAGEVAEAFGITPGRVRTDVKAVRDWLGTNPRTGARHVPDATKSDAAKTRGVNAYQVDGGVLVDADLFRRLRVRGQSRGADGMPDLVQALTLVTGKPFDQLRTAGWGWLLEGDRLDHHLVVAICDVAHLVTTHSLESEDLKRARAAAEIAALAAPYEEITRLDLARVTEAEGYPGEAERILREDVGNRSDDGEAPAELSERTQTIIRSHHWLAAG